MVLTSFFFFFSFSFFVPFHVLLPPLLLVSRRLRIAAGRCLSCWVWLTDSASTHTVTDSNA